MHSMSHKNTLVILQDEVNTATRELKLAEDRLVEVLQDSPEDSPELTSLAWVYSASAEKTRATQRLQVALTRLHEFETKGIVPEDLG